jgi:hypothetical protein
MRCKSVSTVNADAYRAGNEIGASLREISPEVVVLFATISYEPEFPDLFAGFYDGLGFSDVVVFGGTGDGIYETSLTANYGVCALGMNSEGKCHWSVAVEKGVKKDSFTAAHACAQKVLAEAGGQVKFAFLLADGVKADGSKIVSGAGSVLSVPFFGGLTGDDRRFIQSKILINGEVMDDVVAILTVTGDLLFSMNADSGWIPLGSFGKVEDCHGSTINRISGMSAQAFMKEQLGKPLGETEIGVIPLALYQRDGGRHFSLRSSSHIDPASGSITTFGSIEKGTSVRVCTATREEVLNGVRKALAGVNPDRFSPAAAIVISCAGRKWVLEDRGNEEVDEVFAALGKKIPLIGIPSFGEISPFRNPDGVYTRTFFHNVTLAICLIG